MLAILFRYGGRISREEGISKYVDGHTAISSADKEITLTQLQELVTSVCGFNGQVFDYELDWKFGNDVVPINNQRALDGILLICDKCMEVYVTARATVQGGVDGEKAKDSVNRDDIETESPVEIECVDAAETGTHLNGDNVCDLQSSKQMTYRHDPSEFTSGDLQEEFECTDWTAQEESSHDVDHFQRGKRFKDKAALQRHVKMWHIKNSREVYTSKSNSTLVTFKCTKSKSGSCFWYLRGVRKKMGHWEISKLGPPHFCTNMISIQKHKQLDSKVIAEFISPIVSNNVGISIGDLQQIVTNNYACSPSYHKVWYAKQKVIETLFGTQESTLQQLPQMCDSEISTSKRAKRGRKKKVGIHNEMGFNRTPQQNRCAKCGKKGHNKRSCKESCNEL